LGLHNHRQPVRVSRAAENLLQEELCAGALVLMLRVVVIHARRHRG
jgi:hypothetical protein